MSNWDWGIIPKYNKIIEIFRKKYLTNAPPVAIMSSA